MQAFKFLLFLGWISISLSVRAQDLTINTLEPITFSLIRAAPEKLSEKPVLNRDALLPASSGYTSLTEFIQNNTKFPAEALLIGISGVVTAVILIDEKGAIQQIAIATSPDPLLSEEVKRVLSKVPLFLPKLINGKPVPSLTRVEVSFLLF